MVKDFSIFLILGAFLGFGPTGFASQNCYMKGKDKDLVVANLKNYGADERSGYVDLNIIIAKDCTIGQFNQVLKKYGACFLFSFLQNPVVTVGLPSKLGSQVIQETISKMNAEKCMSSASEVGPPPAAI